MVALCQSCDDTGFWICDDCSGEGHFEEYDGVDSSSEVVYVICQYCDGEGMVCCLDCMDD